MQLSLTVDEPSAANAISRDINTVNTTSVFLNDLVT